MGAPKRCEGDQSTLKARLRKSPASQGTGLLQLDALLVGGRPCGERGARLPGRPPESLNADPRSWFRASRKKPEQPEAYLWLSSETVNLERGRPTEDRPFAPRPT